MDSALNVCKVTELRKEQIKRQMVKIEAVEAEIS